MAMKMKTSLTACLLVAVVYIGFLSPTINASTAQKTYKEEKLQEVEVRVSNWVSVPAVASCFFKK